MTDQEFYQLQRTKYNNWKRRRGAKLSAEEQRVIAEKSRLYKRHWEQKHSLKNKP